MLDIKKLIQNQDPQTPPHLQRLVLQRQTDRLDNFFLLTIVETVANQLLSTQYDCNTDLACYLVLSCILTIE